MQLISSKPKNSKEGKEGKMSNPSHFDNLPQKNIPLEKFNQEFEQLEHNFSKESKSPKSLQGKIGLDIINNLPELLRVGCLRLTNSFEQEAYLMSAIGSISGILPNVQGMYHGRLVRPNLFIFVVAKFGTGKGVLNFAKLLGQAIHDAKKAEAEIARNDYHSQSLQYDKDLAVYMKDKTGNHAVPEKPVPPNQKLLFIPANNSKSGFFELLFANNGKGIIFETEADTICDAMRQEYGDYSDGLRRAFQHEPISFYRRAGKEFIEIENPALSVVLSGTKDQLLRLFPSIENGLLSRFIFYELLGTGEFHDPFDDTKADYLNFFEMLGLSASELYKVLQALEQPLEVILTSKQRARFVELFQEWKTEIREHVSEDLDGSVNRLGLICFRLAMIFTVLRVFERKEPFRQVVICEDMDFENAIALTAIIKHHALKVYYMLPETKQPKKQNQPENEAIIRIAKDRRAIGLSYREIAKELRTSHTNIYRWVNGV